MNRQLKRPERFPIVAAMKKPACLLVFLLLAAPAALAQSSRFGLMLGGSKRLTSQLDREEGVPGVQDNWKFGNSVKEAFYAIELEPGTFFKIKVGQITAPGAFRVTTGSASNPQQVVKRRDLEKVDVDHVDAIIDYRFSEAFGSTGLFLGAGLYRQHGTFGSDTDVLPQDRSANETNYGFSGGVNGDFPLSRRYGIVAEAAYHMVNYHYRPRYVTVSGGLRISF